MTGLETASHAAPPAPAAAPPAIANPAATAMTPDAQKAIKEEISRLAPRSEQFSGLPDGDREWVIEETVKVYSYGQIKFENLGDYIHELATTRYHAVHEREHELMTEEMFEVADESQPGDVSQYHYQNDSQGPAPEEEP